MYYGSPMKLIQGVKAFILRVYSLSFSHGCWSPLCGKCPKAGCVIRHKSKFSWIPLREPDLGEELPGWPPTTFCAVPDQGGKPYSLLQLQSPPLEQATLRVLYPQMTQAQLLFVVSLRPSRISTHPGQCEEWRSLHHATGLSPLPPSLTALVSLWLQNFPPPRATAQALSWATETGCSVSL